jgi:hypothetical protein
MFVLEVEKNKVVDLVGPHHLTEYDAYKNIVKHKECVNRIFSELGGTAPLHPRPSKPKRKMQPPSATDLEEVGTSSKLVKRTRPKSRRAREVK